MSVDPELVAAIRAAVERDPDNSALRLHLAELLLDGDAVAALDECRAVLTREPANTVALGLAERAARASGDAAQAAAYGRIVSALAGDDGEPPRPVPAGIDPLAAEIDAILEPTLAAEVDSVVSDVTLADVAGLDDVKRQVQRSFLGPLRNPELREMFGKSLRGGLLLYGPPGCGKTFLARAIAGEVGARFFAVGLHEVLEMWFGQSERNVHEIFESARRWAPCVLFLDEVDALGHKRSGVGPGWTGMRNVVTQLLTELDGIGQGNDGVYLLGATNQPWEVDPALRRPGRFDRTLLVLPPDRAARQAIVERALRDRPLGRVDAGDVAKRTEGFSGADLRLVCEAASELALEDSLETGRARPIDQRDLVQALKGVVPSTRSWFEIARNFATFANQTGEYDELLAYMRRNRLA
jgi:SpoVK/Ycf46/Vps4 family AAA+-type ATPase